MAAPERGLTSKSLSESSSPLGYSTRENDIILLDGLAKRVMDPPILSVKNISKRYGGRIAIENICFNVFRGEVLALLGPNGAGKTTVLRIVSGIARPDNGYVRINGLDPSDPRARSLIGYCPQEPVVYDDLTGLENMLFYAGLYGLSGSEAKRRCMDLLEFVGLSDYASRLVKTYSGGMRRRLSFAIALIGDPMLLILDEPTTGMDPQARREIWAKILGIVKEGRAVIVATHYMEEAEQLANRVIIMDRGRIIAEGVPEELKTRYGPRAVILLKILDRHAEALDALRGIVSEGEILEEDGEIKIHVDDPDEAMPRIVSRLLQEGIKLEMLRVIRPTLEDVFLRLTGRRLSE